MSDTKEKEPGCLEIFWRLFLIGLVWCLSIQIGSYFGELERRVKTLENEIEIRKLVSNI